MYLKRLELSGFKSFAKKTVFDLDNTITAIVGPNGSGKSNVAEAMRFVLGEQSMKSLRGKLGSDLIFKGSKTHSAIGRASVSIVFDNRKRIFSKHDQSEGAINVDFDEVIISREVYGDGRNLYLVNGSPVRLKDILELLAPLNIGSSGHHIISQGESDKILNASIVERKEMIEDSLGLRVYQYKIIESERKLEKTNENVKEAESLRREIAPHINFLKKQVEKIEKGKAMRDELKTLYFDYLKREDLYLKEEEKKGAGGSKVRDELKKLDLHIGELKRELTLSPENESSERRGRETEDKLQELRNKKDELSRRLGRLEGIIELEEERESEENKSSGELGLTMVSLYDVEEMERGIEALADKANTAKEVSFFREILIEIKDLIRAFIKRKKSEKETPRVKILERLKNFKGERETVKNELEEVSKNEKEATREIEKIKKILEDTKESLRDKERSFFELSAKRSDLASQAGLLSMKEEKFKSERNDFLRELDEAIVLVGVEVKNYHSAEIPKAAGVEARSGQEERRKKIERIKIRLEDIGLGSSEETLKEYEEISSRDKFLETEIADLKKSKLSLEELIAELKEKLGTLFREGISKINTQFAEFFKMMFGGGTASLSIVKREKRHYRVGEDDEEESLFDQEGGEEKEFEEGIEVNVSLPQKKIKDLAILSGGERALTSIALLFAITQVNPPPFLVLDETDAALDEANSRKYGDMLENLSKLSHLIVITHNRETMSRTNVLYGVTMGADGTSKLLSVKFDEAASYAK